MRRIALPLLLTAFALTGGCSDSPVEPADPLHPPAPSPSISDAAHGGGAGFHFLPPMGDDVAPAAPFDGALAPVVTVCEGATTDCSSPVAEFTTTTGPGSETVRVDPDDEHYIVDWHTDRFALDPTVHYRVVVSVVPAGAGQRLVLGYADVDLLATAAGRNDVDTDVFVPLVDGATLPIKFRVEEGIVGRIVVEPTSATIPVGGTQSFSATLYDLHGEVLDGPAVSWTSGDPAVATVDGSGLATATGAGTTLITAASQRVSDDAELTVETASPVGTLDVNGDGRGDLLAAGQPFEFAFTEDVYAHFGNGSGVSTGGVLVVSSPIFNGFASGGWNLGDLDGDGRSDVAIASRLTNEVFLYHGSDTGVDAPAFFTTSGPDASTFCSDFSHYGSCFGAALGSGDVDGDGFIDLVVGAKEYLYVYRGSSSGFDTMPTQTIRDPIFSFVSDGYGLTVAVGDFDGDGFDDIATGAHEAGGGLNGLVYVYSGSETGIETVPTTLSPGSECQFFCGFGTDLAADDFNGDGIDDLAVGAPGAVFYSGTVFIFDGGAEGIAASSTAVTGSNQLGTELTALGDFDGDGFHDLAATGLGADVSILPGGSAGPTTVGATVQGPGAVDYFGQFIPQRIVGAGDLDGDGQGDLAVSQSSLDPDDDTTREGSLWVYYGRATDATAPDLELGATGTFEYGLMDGLGYNPGAD